MLSSKWDGMTTTYLTDNYVFNLASPVEPFKLTLEILPQHQHGNSIWSVVSISLFAEQKLFTLAWFSSYNTDINTQSSTVWFWPGWPAPWLPAFLASISLGSCSPLQQPLGPLSVLCSLALMSAVKSLLLTPCVSAVLFKSFCSLHHFQGSCSSLCSSRSLSEFGQLLLLSKPKPLEVFVALRRTSPWAQAQAQELVQVMAQVQEWPGRLNNSSGVATPGLPQQALVCQNRSAWWFRRFKVIKCDGFRHWFFDKFNLWRRCDRWRRDWFYSHILQAIQNLPIHAKTAAIER